MKKLIASLALVALLALSGCAWLPVGDAVYQPGADTSPSIVDVPTSPAPTPAATPTPTVTQEPVLTTEPTPTPTPYDYSMPVAESEAVDEGWFADAVLIGDSRTDGMRLYSGIRGVDILCHKGLTVFEVMEDKPVIQTAGGKTGVLQALAEKQYAKVYISLGVNELGYYDDPGFADTYAAMVDRIRQLQPDADIYLQTLIPVNTQKCKETKQPYYVTNKQVAIYNEIIRNLAVEKQTYLLEVGEIFVDESGELFYDASFDGVHFYKDGYVRWYDYLKTHTVKEADQ